VRLATARRVAGAILESPYTSTVAVGEIHYWMFPVGWLMRDHYDSLSRIKDIHAPLLVMHGGADQVIPQSQGRELFEAALPPKRGYFPAAAHHVDLINYGGMDQVDAFIAEFWTDGQANGQVTAPPHSQIGATHLHFFCQMLIHRSVQNRDP
jgi:hypothetical protein